MKNLLICLLISATSGAAATETDGQLLFQDAHFAIAQLSDGYANNYSMTAPDTEHQHAGIFSVMYSFQKTKRRVGNLWISW